MRHPYPQPLTLRLRDGSGREGRMIVKSQRLRRTVMKTMVFGHCKTTDLINSQKLLSAFTRSSQPIFKFGVEWVHESPSLIEKLWRIDDFQGKESQFA